MEWFDQRNVPLKIENDNRTFPESNSSQTIINTF
jgi:predicted flavoprotein YhiN